MESWAGPRNEAMSNTRLLFPQNGHSLGEDTSLQDLWTTGLTSYSNGEWEQAIDTIEEALRLFNHYDNQTYICLKKCKEEGESAASVISFFLKMFFFFSLCLRLLLLRLPLLLLWLLI